MRVEAGEALGAGRNHIITRPRLTRLLDEANARIIVLVAPAGYGKTTLAREWLGERRQAWYHGNSATGDVAALALGIGRAAASIVPGADDRLSARIRVSRTPSDEVEMLAQILAEDLQAWPRGAWLVVDDYHFACDSGPSERFLEHLGSLAPLSLLVTSRSQPSWATARRVLYGEIYEVGRNLLAMNGEEAHAVLRSGGKGQSGALIALCDGWPALLSLAALTDVLEVPDAGALDELYEYFAEELYQAVPAMSQRDLTVLSLTPIVTEELATTLVGDRALKLLEDAAKLGFLSASHGRPAFHPLLRTFLMSKFIRPRDDANGSIILGLVRKLLEHEEWDAAYDLIERFFDDTALNDLFDAALTKMVDQARLPTLERWLETARTHRVDSPLVDLVEAELDLAKGRWRPAEALSLRASRRLPLQHPSRSKALWIAGTSAHLLFRVEDALDHFAAAAESAQSAHDRAQSIWGLFMARSKLADAQEANRLLEQFASSIGESTDELLRVASGMLNMVSLTGNVQRTLLEVDSLASLVDKSRDPLVSSSFLYIYSAVLAVYGRYKDALATADHALAIANAYRLLFPIPYVHLNAGWAALGLRRFRQCQASLRACERTSAQGDEFLFMNLIITKAKLHLSTGSIQLARDLLERHQHLSSTQSMAGEYLAWRGLGHALAHEWREAVSLTGRAEELSQRIEVTGLTAWVKAMAAMRAKRTARRPLQEAWTRMQMTGNVDAFVTAYRCSSDLLEFAAKNWPPEDLKRILERSNDHKLAEAVGLRLPPVSDAPDRETLSKREHQVIELVAQGLMNKQIAQALFITEGTVKVHLRHICRKLGVRSRTEAAMRYSELSDSL